MPDRPQADLPGLSDYRNWKPEAQQRALALLREHSESTWQPFYCPSPGCDGHPHDDWGWEHARADQHPPAWSDGWLTWFMTGGRGSGKTRTGSEVTHRVTRKVGWIGLVAATGPDLREIMVEGESGILATARPGERPLWEPSRKKLTWPNGAIGQGFSAEEPDRLRGPQHGFVWADEPAHWPLVVECWDNISFGLRIGSHPKIVATSTPLPTKWVKKTLNEPTTIRTRVSTYANLTNLAPPFAELILARYEGTRTGKQELHGEVLEDVEGALWTWDMFEWVESPPPLQRIVVGVDPAGSKNKSSDETGIITVGIGTDRCLYVLDDGSGRYTPAGWAAKANSLYEDTSADCIVAEKNYGGDMVRHTLETSGHTGGRIKLVTSRRGKEIRAEPIVALYEKHRVKHVGERGDLSVLEEELCLVAGTMIETRRGHVPIEQVRAGDEVLTRTGFAPVEWAGQTKRESTLTLVTHEAGCVLSTVWHRVWTANRGFVPAWNVQPTDRLVVRPSPASTAHLLPGAVTGTPGWARAATSGMPEVPSSTGSSGQPTTDPSRRAWSSITATRTRPTMTPPTWNSSPTPSTSPCTDLSVVASWTGPPSDDPRTVVQVGSVESPVYSCVSDAVRPLSRRAPALAGVRASVDDWLAATEVPVYDIKVADRYLPEFFANGVLVHNTTWVPGRSDSPNRLDALVHAATELARHAMPAAIAVPTQTDRTVPVPRHLRAV
jgi:phage terminase large subunit-like protein